MIAVLGLLAALMAAGCAHADRAMLVSESGLTAAEARWDAEYHRRLDVCAAKCEPMTPCAEQCFGPTYDADAKVNVVIGSVVTMLRVYWTARAAGEQPDWLETARAVAKALDALPPEAREYFDRVRGVR
jgi:hypothetical protein